jgi:hypothetical protein
VLGFDELAERLSGADGSGSLIGPSPRLSGGVIANPRDVTPVNAELLDALFVAVAGVTDADAAAEKGVSSARFLASACLAFACLASSSKACTLKSNSGVDGWDEEELEELGALIVPTALIALTAPTAPTPFVDGWAEEELEALTSFTAPTAPAAPIPLRDILSGEHIYPMELYACKSS